MRIRKAAVAAGIAASAALGVPGIASGAPKGEPVTVTCGTNTYQVVVVPGRARFTPGIVVDGAQGVIKPVGFGAFTGRLLDPSGNVIEEFTDPEESFQGQAAAKNPHVQTCTYTFRFEDPEGFVFIGEGVIYALVAPRR